MSLENIFPFFDKIIPQGDKERFLKQRAKVIWFTGLSGSGKSSLALRLEKELFIRGFHSKLLDGDNIRSGINRNLSFSSEDRVENIRRIAEISKLFLKCGIITVNGFVSPTEDIRNMAKEIIGRDSFIEVFVNTPIEVCEERDTKGLYKKAREGKILNFTGVNAPFESPLDPTITVSTENKTVEESVNEILEYIIPRITY
ncbi:MAG: adenylyl-sulfate kinase [Bacteroidales bacterium]|jgi:adenylylsulfate kinase|nr:adenylyl-sulfate kinase [Bacteroidales bacterium]